MFELADFQRSSNVPSFLSLFGHCVLLILHCELLGHRRLLLVLLLLLAAGRLLQNLKLGVGLHDDHLLLGDGESPGEQGGAGRDLEGLMELNGHAESEEHHIRVGILRPKRLMGQLQTGGAVYCPVHTGHLGGGERNYLNFLVLTF